ncbi:fibroin heavy chain-like [Petaurus breviceps papuanus]|uniref:fibroin heavy chain-like n=1 Tax=Petaurus breviceps papuanus TaxID=3040969 RepID=UPI0036DCD186
MPPPLPLLLLLLSPPLLATARTLAHPRPPGSGRGALTSPGADAWASATYVCRRGARRARRAPRSAGTCGAERREAGGAGRYHGNRSVARRCACVAERGSEAVSSAPFPAVAGAELGGGRGGGGGSSSVGRGTLHTGRWPEVAHRVPPGINDLTRSRSRRCRLGGEGRWFGGRAGRGLRRRRGQERRQAVGGAGGAGAAAALGAWGGRAVPGWASPGRRLPAAQLLASGGDWRKPVSGPVMSD